MKPYKIIYIDKEGKKEQREFRSGIKIISLLEPSNWYKKNVLKPAQEEYEKEKKDLEHKSKIQEKLKEMAEKELEKEEEGL